MTDTASQLTLNLYDISRWKPITPDMFANELLNLSMWCGGDTPDTKPEADIKLVSEGVDEERFRLVAYAHVRSLYGHDDAAGPNGEDLPNRWEPYLLVMGNPLAQTDRQGRGAPKTVCFIRTDVCPMGM